MGTPREPPTGGPHAPRRVVEVVDPDPAWPEQFAGERDRLLAGIARRGARDEVVAVEHIGSTAVPGLAAKPILDLLIGVRAWPASRRLIAGLEGQGYVHRGEAGIVGRHYLQDAPSGAPRTRQLHVVEHGGRIWRDQLRFRDHLRSHREDRDRYGRLKRELARAHRHDVLGYLDGKRPFVRAVLARARARDGEVPLHATAREGFLDAERYERGRPGYPADALAWLTQRLPLGAGRRVADVGAGTGKLTRALVGTGAHVLAVEPVAAMRDALTGAEVVDGTAEDLPVPHASLDVVAAGQAFHWFEPAAALSEAHRVLREGGAVALLWNEQDESVPWVAAWTRLSDRLRGTTPDRRRHPWREVVAGTALFEGPETAGFDNPHTLTREALLDRVASSSFVATLDAAARRDALAEFTAVLDADPATRGRERVTVPYRTEVHLLRRVP